MKNEKWSERRAWEWYRAQNWIRGYCGYPSVCVNRIALWQEYGHEAVFEQVEREFALAKSTGLNAVRAFIQFEVWQKQHDSFMRNLEEYFALADKHGIKVMLVLGNDCTVAKSRWKPVIFGEQRVDWGYHSGIKGGQHAGDYREAGYQLLDDPDVEPLYYDMVAELAEKYGRDERLQVWNVWNEIGNSNRGNMSVPAMERFFDILREKNVMQPLTADVWSYDGNMDVNGEAERRALELSDVISFHWYGSFERMAWLIDKLKRFNRPLLCTEWLNRIEGNDVEHLLPLFWLENIGSYHWGLMQGYSQTYEPWGAYFIRQEKGENLDLTKWQHDIYRFNGLPYIPREIEVFRRFAELADKRENNK